MANKNPYNGPNKKRFKKGVTLNPGGMKKGVVPKKEWKMHTAASVAETLSKLQDLTIPELRAISESLTLPALEVIMAKAMMRDRMEGELDNMEKILDRCVGKVKQTTEFQGPGGIPIIPPTFNFVPMDANSVKTPENSESNGQTDVQPPDGAQNSG